MLEAAGDPEKLVPVRLAGYTPVGIKEPVLPSGIFPTVDATGVGPSASRHWECHELVGTDFDNYTSYDDNVAAADAELDREIKAGYVIWAKTKHELELLVGALVPSRVGAIVKAKADGITKVRLIHDLRQSGVNAFIRLQERLVLPRLSDAVEMLQDMLQQLQPGEEVELMVFDFAD
eukprot:16430066-Heterocapsa_arctica.AAC.1